MLNKRRLLLIVFALLLLTVPAVQAQDMTQLIYGESVDGRVDDPDTGILYVFAGQEGDVVTISAESPTVDVYLRLGDSQGNLLVEHDDISRTNLNAFIEYELPEDGEYIIAVLAYEAGRYTVTLESNTSGAVETEAGTIAYGDTVSGDAIDLETPIIFTFNGSAGDTVSITAESDDIDTYLVLADREGNSLAEHDDISSDNLNAYIEVVLPANGEYIIGVFAYSSGPFTLSLDTNSSGMTTPVVGDSGGGEITTGEITNDEPYIMIPLEGVAAGDTITIEARASSGDLDLYLGLFYGDTVVAENDDRDSDTLNSFIEYPQAQEGDYTIVVTRYGFEDGETTGSFEASIKVSSGSTVVTGGQPIASNPIANGYPEVQPSDEMADWTVLVYMGGDNNLEDGLINDLDEFEIAGGSTESVRVVVLLDRSGDYDDSNDDWTTARIFEVGGDTSDDARSKYPPTIDTIALADLGEIDTSYGSNLLDFLVWGIQAYPARHYAISLNDHGGAWYGIVTDDTTGRGILSITTLQGVFKSALDQTGIDSFDLLINDACLMSSTEYYAGMAPYFDYVLSSPEITLNPSFDMTLLANTLNDDPNIDIGELGQLLVDKYLQDMTDLSPDTAPVLGAAITDLREVGGLIDAVENFATVVNENPAAYNSFLGQIRANTYTYSFFLPEEEFGPATNIDLGDFMSGVVINSRDQGLSAAAQAVLDAMQDSTVYSNAGSQLGRYSSYYNIYFPQRSTDFDPSYFQESPLQNWAQMLRALFGSVSPQSRAFRAGGVAAPAEAPSVVPVVSITNVFPTETSIAYPITVSMEVTGRNISHGNFTVDQIQPDGTMVRLDSSRIVTEVIEDGVVDYINLWTPGVDDSDFTWDTELPVLSDDSTSHYEMVTTQDGISSIAGLYRYPGDEAWLDVTVVFDDDGNTSNVISRRADSAALSSIRLETGGEFLSYRSVVTPDGRIELQAGNIYIWPEDGISWDFAPAPSGEYNLGFLVEAFGGTTGFNSVTITVANDPEDPNLRGYVDDDWGFVFQRPADWFDVTYFPDSDFLQTSDVETTEYIFVYPVYDAEDDLEAIVNDVLGRYNVDFDGTTTPITVAGQDALEFEFTYGNSESGEFTSRAFAIYREDLQLGLVFSSEALDADNMEANYQLLLDTLTFFDPLAVEEQDTGVWGRDRYTENDRYPVREDWLPGAENGLFWFYTPDNVEDSNVFAAATALIETDDDAETVLNDILEQEVEDFDDYTLTGTETYYGEQETWEMAIFTHEGENGEEITGRMYATVVDNTPFLLWFEAPTAEFDAMFRDVFTVMLDGFRITSAEEQE